MSPLPTVRGGVKFHRWDSVYDTLSESEADKIRKEIGKEISVEEIETEKLEFVLDKFLPPNQIIDILNIDAEGCDLEVLKSNNWQKYKPRFVVVEDYGKDIKELLKSEKFEFFFRLGYRLVSFTCCSYIFSRV